jgi:two-component system NarL family sensor kinase
MRHFLSHLRLSYGQKLFLLATLPLVLAVAAISILVANQSSPNARSRRWKSS